MKIQHIKEKILRKKTLFIFLSVLCLMALIYLGASFFQGQIAVDPEPLLTTALHKTQSLDSFRYQSEAKIITKEKESYYAKITGEKVLPGKTHIKGTMVQTPIDIYLIDEITYLKNEMTDGWQILTENPIAKSDILISEINPLIYLDFEEINEVELLRMEKKEGKNYAVIEAKPLMGNSVLEMSNKDFNYEFWINPEDQYIAKIKLNTKSKVNPDTQMAVVIDLYDYNSPDIKLDPPVTEDS